MTQNVMASDDAAEIRIDLAAWKQQVDVLETENARLTEEVERLKASRLDFIELKSAQKHIADLQSQLAEARVRPALDVEAVVGEIYEQWKTSALGESFRDVQIKVLRKYVTDAPAKPADETLAAAVARVQAETRRECAAMVREWRGGHFLGADERNSLRSLADCMERGE